MSAPDEYKKPTFRELTRIGTNDRGEDVFANKKDKADVEAHERAQKHSKRRSTSKHGGKGGENMK